jgi:hypothetical protein
MEYTDADAVSRENTSFKSSHDWVWDDVMPLSAGLDAL